MQFVFEFNIFRKLRVKSSMLNKNRQGSVYGSAFLARTIIIIAENSYLIFILSLRNFIIIYNNNNNNNIETDDFGHYVYLLVIPNKLSIITNGLYYTFTYYFCVIH